MRRDLALDDRVQERRDRSDRSYLLDLINVLSAHPKGLRRWSVMRAVRTMRENAGRPVPQKFEDEMERAFRKSCAGSEAFRTHSRPGAYALFYLPEGKAGEVWAVYPDHADAWLKSESTQID